MRICKICKIGKQFNYFMLDDRARAVYKDEFGTLWHGKVCYACFKAYVIKKANKKPLSIVSCKVCEKSFKQKNIRQTVCSEACYKTVRKEFRQASL